MKVRPTAHANGMNPRLVHCLALLLMVASGCMQGRNVQANSPIQSRVDSLAAKLNAREIGKVEVLQIPPSVETRTRITPEMLEVQYSYKLTIRDLRGQFHQKELAEAVRETKVQPGPNMPDLRWGIVFYSLDGTRVLGLYFDRNGSKGAVGDVPVSFGGHRLFKWLDDNFSASFR